MPERGSTFGQRRDGIIVPVPEVNIPLAAQWKHVLQTALQLSFLTGQTVREAATIAAEGHLGKIPATAEFFPTKSSVYNEPEKAVVRYTIQRLNGVLAVEAMWHMGSPRILFAEENGPDPKDQILLLVAKALQLKAKEGPTPKVI